MHIDVNLTLSILCWAGMLLLLLVLIRLAWVKGAIGRLLVSLTARLFLNDYAYQLISNVTVPDADGTIRIDYIVVSRFGIFVIEVMPAAGVIAGDEQQTLWKQQLGEHERWFANPLHESDSRIATLAASLQLPQALFFPLVVFVGDCSFSGSMPEQVSRDGNYVYYIRSKSELLLSPADVQDVTRQLSSRPAPAHAFSQLHEMHS
ncbi:NERD domain-containing protein [Mariprofundus erugo]|uniref:nuclease-related domain-containing protein n=1 Tax=Mariprofundus erugo TaxID=2528639 RepID=UPI0010FEC93A|nr:nuclease-related domain-containing protein [Mariprofundus erugo]TLS73678.1 NERD domain-containing protein [Mariprofundus erugo]